jgi:FkbM family methyltransferase
MQTAYEYKAYARNLLARVGLRKRQPPDRSVSLLAQHGIDVVLDVGANIGQYARSLLRMGYRGRIVSFEPLPSARRRLEANARGVPGWQIVPVALGDFDGQSTINVAGNSQSSSLLAMLPQHVAAAPESAYVSAEVVEVRRLDSLFSEHCRAGERCFLKLDVQGFEQAVLRGARESLARCVGVQLEMSLMPLYEGEATFTELLAQMADHGYSLMWLENGFVDPHSGRLLQLDGVFYRTAAIEAGLARAA